MDAQTLPSEHVAGRRCSGAQINGFALQKYARVYRAERDGRPLRATTLPYNSRMLVNIMKLAD